MLNAFYLGDDGSSVNNSVNEQNIQIPAEKSKPATRRRRGAASPLAHRRFMQNLSSSRSIFCKFRATNLRKTGVLQGLCEDEAAHPRAKVGAPHPRSFRPTAQRGLIKSSSAGRILRPTPNYLAWSLKVGLRRASDVNGCFPNDNEVNDVKGEKSCRL